MKFFYYSTRQLIIAVVAAYIHLEKFSEEPIPSAEKIITIPKFDQFISGDLGIPTFIGEKSNHQVYALALDSNHHLALQAIKDVLSQREVDLSQWRFFYVGKDKALCGSSLLIKMGQLLSRKRVTGSLGKRIIAWGIQRNYWKLLKLVKTVREPKTWGKEK